MIFNSDEWKMIRNHFPLRNEEVKDLEMQVADTCMLVHGLIMWGLALQNISSPPLTQEQLFCPYMGW
jgi:hypothetical protein